MTELKPIYILNGPNLNRLGKREPEIYGRDTLADMEAWCRQAAGERPVAFHQTNSEERLIDLVHEAIDEGAGIIINPAGYSHTSIALHDALMAVKLPTVEVHVSNIFAREPFRHHSFVSSAAVATLCGFGIDGYRLAISGLAARIGAKAKA